MGRVRYIRKSATTLIRRRPQEAPGGPRRPQEAIWGLWGPLGRLGASGGLWEPLVALWGLLEQPLGALWWHLVALVSLCSCIFIVFFPVRTQVQGSLCPVFVRWVSPGGSAD